MSPLNLGDIAGKVQGILGGGGQKAAQTQPGYPSMISLTMGDYGFETAAKVIALLPANGAKARIWEMTVPGGAWKYRYGFGHPALPDNQGYWWFVIADANVGFCNGIVTLAYESYDRHTYIPIEEKNDVVLNSGIAQPITIATGKLIDKKQMQALPEGGAQGNPAYVQQFSRLVIDYKAIARSTTEDIADFNIPLTIYS
jgi:hypothetical protein